MKYIWPVLFLALAASGCTPPDDGGNSLPPDPGAAGKVTLAGIDSDNDGVRDDIQIAIYDRYPNNIQIQNALKQSAKTLQNTLIVGANSGSAEQTADTVTRARHCIKSLVGSQNQMEEIDFIVLQLINTKERSDAFTDFNASMHGTVYTVVTIPNPCD